MIEWIAKNLEWVFSGIGVFILSAVFTAYKFQLKHEEKKTQNEGFQSTASIKDSENCNNGTTINANGNSQVVVNTQVNPKSLGQVMIDQEKKVLNIEGQKAQTNILFIDNEDFQIVSIIKKAGWKNCSLIKKISDLNTDRIKKAQIIFVDIRGVGEELFGKDAGLGVAKALKEKYPDTIVILYSAENNWNIFHDALTLVDDKIEKNAKPIEFISMIEMYADKIWKKG